MLEFRVILYTFNLTSNEAQHFLLHLFIVGFDSLFEIIGAIFVCEVCNDGTRHKRVLDELRMTD